MRRMLPSLSIEGLVNLMSLSRLAIFWARDLLSLPRRALSRRVQGLMFDGGRCEGAGPGLVARRPCGAASEDGEGVAS
jgi:hypothetical protein